MTIVRRSTTFAHFQLILIVFVCIRTAFLIHSQPRLIQNVYWQEEEPPLIPEAKSTTLNRTTANANPPRATVSSKLTNIQTLWKKEEEPLVNRWGLRFGNKSGYVFFKHLRKAGGTTVRDFLIQAMQYNGEHREEAILQTRNSTLNEKMSVVYYEQEFTSMDWQCPQVDERWKATMSVIALRHPIERQLSEFFYSGPGSDGVLNDLFRRHEYSSPEFASLLRKSVPPWIKFGMSRTKRCGCFGKHFSDNLQLRALVGSTTVAPISFQTKNLDLKCTQFHQGKQLGSKKLKPHQQMCDQNQKTCPNHCDGPCQYGNGFRAGVPVNWDVLSDIHLERAVQTLDSFDVVLLTETVSEPVQLSFLADVTSVPLDKASAFLGNSNARIVQHNAAARQNGYQEILREAAPELIDLLLNHSRLEMELYQHAIERNLKLIQQWKEEKQS